MMGFVECTALLFALVFRLKLKHRNVGNEILHLMANRRQRPVALLLASALVQRRQEGRSLHTTVHGQIGENQIHLLQQTLVLLRALGIVHALTPVVRHQVILFFQHLQTLNALSVRPCRQIDLQLCNGQSTVAFIKLLEDGFQRVIQRFHFSFFLIPSHVSTRAISVSRGPLARTYLILLGNESTTFAFILQRFTIRSR